MFKRFNLRTLGIAAFVIVVTAVLPLTGLIYSMDLKASDIAFRVRGLIRGPLPQSDDVVIVAIDDESFNETGLQWPWPRGYFAKIIRGISAGNPRVIVVDVFWYEAGSDPGGDEALAAAIAEAGNVILANDLLYVQQRVSENEIYLLEQFRQPLPLLTQAASGLGLAIVKHVLQRHQGQLNIDSEVGRGSTFQCNFPTHMLVHTKQRAEA